MSMSNEPSLEERFEGLLASEEDGGEAEESEIEAPDEGQAEIDDDAEVEANDEADTEDYAVDEDDDAEENEADPDDPPALEVDFDGETVRITAEEAKAGILRQADYTRKTMALAEERKALEADRQQAKQWFQQQLAVVQQFQEPEPDWVKMRDEDPIGYIQQRDAWNEKQAQRQQMQQQTEAQLRAAYQQQMQEGQARLVDALPSWRDDTVRKKESAEITDGLVNSYGFRPEELQGLADHRLVLLARDAIKGRQAAKSTDIARKKVADKPKVQKPGSSTGKGNPARTAAAQLRKRAQQTQSPDDWAKAFETLV